MNIKQTLLLCALFTYPTQSWATMEHVQTYAQAQVGIHKFLQGVFMPTSVEDNVLKVTKHGINMDLQKTYVLLESFGIVIYYREVYYDEAFSEMRSLHARAPVGTLVLDFDASNIRTVQLKLMSGEIGQYAVSHAGS